MKEVQPSLGFFFDVSVPLQVLRDDGSQELKVSTAVTVLSMMVNAESAGGGGGGGGGGDQHKTTTTTETAATTITGKLHYALNIFYFFLFVEI